MRLVLAEFNNVLGLKGKISFAPSLPLILYAPNIAGKTNAITAIRLCFLGHRIFREILKEEVLLNPLNEGHVTCYFSQWDRMYKLTYNFKRSGVKVRRSCKLSSISQISIDPGLTADQLAQLLTAQEWKDEAKTPSDIKIHLEQIQIYPEVMDILLASSNIEGYIRAMEGEVCNIPEALSKQLTDAQQEADLNLKRLEKIKGYLQSLSESAETYLNDQKKHLAEIGLQPGRIKQLFTGEVSRKLDAFAEDVGKRLARGIPEDIEKALQASSHLKPSRKKLEAIQSLRTALDKKASFNELIQKKSKYDVVNSQWKDLSSRLRALPKTEWNLDEYDVPSIRKLDLTAFKDSSDIREFFRKLRKCKLNIITVKKTALEHGIDSITAMKKTAEELNRTLQSFKNPQKLPENSIPASIIPQAKRALPVVSVPMDKYEAKLAKVSGTTRVHIPEKASTFLKRKLTQRIAQLEREVNELRSRVILAEKTERQYKEIHEGLASLLRKKQRELEQTIKELEDQSSEIQGEWRSTSTILYDQFGIGKITFEFEEDSYERDLKELQSKITYCRGELEKEVGQVLSGFRKLRSELVKKLELANFDIVVQKLSERTRRLESERKKLEAIQKWLQSEAQRVKDSDRKLRYSKILTRRVIPFAEGLYGLVYRLINLDEMVESLGVVMERNVETAYQSIFADPTFKFTHIGKGIFTPKLDNQRITNPSGSQSAAVSFGVLYTLADQFKLPLVMDEAADRFDPTRLANFLELAKTVTASDTKQICLAVYETRNIDPPQLDTFNTYECVRISNAEKLVRPLALKAKTL